MNCFGGVCSSVFLSSASGGLSRIGSPHRAQGFMSVSMLVLYGHRRSGLGSPETGAASERAATTSGLRVLLAGESGQSQGASSQDGLDMKDPGQPSLTGVAWDAPRSFCLDGG